MRYAKKVPVGSRLRWFNGGGKTKSFIYWDDQTSGNKSFSPVKLTSRGPFKRLMRRIAQFFDWLAY